MQIIEAGVAVDSDNIDFYEQLGNFAFAGAEQVRRDAQVGGADGMTPEVRELYGKAIAAYERVFTEKGAETLVSQLRNVAAAQLQLGNVDEAISFSERAIESHPDEPSVRAIFAEALKEAGKITEAVAALAAIEEIDPNWPNLHLRMGNWLIEEGRIEEAVPILQKAVANGSSPDQAGNMIFSQAYAAHVQPTTKNYPRFIELISLAKDFDVSTQASETYDFWHAFSLYQSGIVLQESETLEAANRTLPMFRNALTFFQRGKGYADRTASINFQQFVDATTTYIEIQEAIIARADRN
jgi:tetratricopeptide (TPR) repeat protein